MSIQKIYHSFASWFTPVNIAHLIHWVFIVSGVIASSDTLIQSLFTGHLGKFAAFGPALIGAAQIVHKFTDKLDKAQTIDLAVVQAASAAVAPDVEKLKKEIPVKPVDFAKPTPTPAVVK